MTSSAPTVAVIGGGQLARMMAQAAVALGVPLRLLAEAPGVSAAQVVADAVVGDYRDLDTLRAVTEGCAVVTFITKDSETDVERFVSRTVSLQHPWVGNEMNVAHVPLPRKPDCKPRLIV